MRKLLLLVAFVLVSCGPPATAKPYVPGSGSGASASNPGSVRYIVKGRTHAASVTYQNAQGGTEQKDIAVPWQADLQMSPGDFVYLSAQNKDDSGTVICEIWVDGALYKTSTSDGAYVIASCSGTVGR